MGILGWKPMLRERSYHAHSHFFLASVARGESKIEDYWPSSLCTFCSIPMPGGKTGANELGTPVRIGVCRVQTPAVRMGHRAYWFSQLRQYLVILLVQQKKVTTVVHTAELSGSLKEEGEAKLSQG